MVCEQNGGAKALVLSSSSVTWVMLFTWILAKVVFRRTCHGQRLLVQGIKFSFHLKSVFFMAFIYPRQNSRFAFDVQVYHLTLFFTMRYLRFIIQHCCLRCDIGVSQWDIGLLTFNIQDSSLSFNIQVLNWTSLMNGWPFEANPLRALGARSHARQETSIAPRQHVKKDSNATNARSALRCVAELLLPLANDGQ